MAKELWLVVLILLAGCQSSYFKQNYIQGHHTSVEYELKSNSKLIQDVTIKNVYCHSYTGASMNPALFEGNVVCFKEYRNESLKQGNIIHYVNGGGDDIHRIVAVQPDVLLVQGDNNNAQDLVNRTQVRGVLVMMIYK